MSYSQSINRIAKVLLNPEIVSVPVQDGAILLQDLQLMTRGASLLESLAKEDADGSDDVPESREPDVASSG